MSFQVTMNFRELTDEANKSMARQNKEMHVIKRQMEDRIEALNGTVDKKERGLTIKLQETKEKFAKVQYYIKINVYAKMPKFQRSKNQ
jgi:hypothetical protein